MSCILANYGMVRLKVWNNVTAFLHIHYRCHLPLLSLCGLLVLRIGFISDERMLDHECIWVPSFPERPQRLKAAMDRVREYGLLDRCVIIPVSYPSALLCRHFDAIGTISSTSY